MTDTAIEHYLITGHIPGGHLHAYLATSSQRLLDGAREKIMETLQESRDPMAMVILETKLVTKSEVVREILARTGTDEVRRMLASDENYFMLFTLPESTEDDQTLMDLH